MEALENSDAWADSFVMGPHAEDLHHPLLFQNLIYQAVLNVDPARVGACQITHELFIGRRVYEWISGQNSEKVFGLRPQTGSVNFLCVLRGLPGKDDLPVYQRMFFTHDRMGVFIPRRIDSLIPGIDNRNRVSWMERQSSSETSTPFERLPVIRTGSWDSAVSSNSPYKFDRALLALTTFAIGSIVRFYVRTVNRGRRPMFLCSAACRWSGLARSLFLVDRMGALVKTPEDHFSGSGLQDARHRHVDRL